MAVPQLLLGTLEDLREDDFETFKWHLTNGVFEGCKPIPLSRLEKKSRRDTVSRMIESYGVDKSVINTVEILKKMSHNDAAEKLKNKYAELTTNTSAVAPTAAPVAPPAAPATMLAQQGSVIIAPTVAGGTSGAWNITINK
ncbi:caspase b-like [Sebastes fasciatus]|uniref:caspase b-like n=1 Tax=Sebastes fasciatus TaxID=394691 RepID=UPI003D9F08C4